jgi:hypothetical protein
MAQTGTEKKKKISRCLRGFFSRLQNKRKSKDKKLNVNKPTKEGRTNFQNVYLKGNLLKT